MLLNSQKSVLGIGKTAQFKGALGRLFLMAAGLSLLALFWALPLKGCFARTTELLKPALILEGLSSPVVLAHAQDERLFVVEQPGRIRIVLAGSLLPEPYLDISNIVEARGYEQGLLGLAFHPSYPKTPYCFVVYTAKNGGALTLARYTVSQNPDKADPASGLALLSIPHPHAANHNGGQLQFGPADGYLYWGTGDGGKGCDSTDKGCNAQKLDVLLGKLLRLDVNIQQAPFYAAPTSNPFYSQGGNPALIWALGLRNPWKFSFDRKPPHDLYIGDVGQSTREEVDRQPGGSSGGLNYGWPLAEGAICNTCAATVAKCPDPSASCSSYAAPIHDYPRSDGISVIGGYVYRGLRIPALQGLYIFGDYGPGHIWALDAKGERTLLLSGMSGLTAFGEDLTGELYFTQASGRLWRLEPALLNVK